MRRPATTCRAAAYKGLSVPSPKSKRNGLIVLLVLLILCLLMACVGAGSSNGFGNFGSDRMLAAEALDLGIVGYWQAMTVIESLLWLGATGLGGFAFYQIATVSARNRVACVRYGVVVGVVCASDTGQT